MENQVKSDENTQKDEAQLSDHEKKSRVNPAIQAVKSFFLVIFSALKAVILLFWNLSIVNKIVFIILVLFIILVSYFVGYFSGKSTREAEIEQDLGLSIEQTKEVINQIKELNISIEQLKNN